MCNLRRGVWLRKPKRDPRNVTETMGSAALLLSRVPVQSQKGANNMSAVWLTFAFVAGCVFAVEVIFWFVKRDER